MPIVIGPPASHGPRLVVATAAFDPVAPDFDEAMLAAGLAVEATGAGWDVEVLALSSSADLASRLGATLEAFRRAGIRFGMVPSDDHPQSRAAALAKALVTRRADRVVAMEPSLLVYHAEAQARCGSGGLADSVVVVSRPVVEALDRRGRFLDDSTPHLTDLLARRAIGAARSCIVPSEMAGAFARLHPGRDRHELDAAALIGRLMPTIGAAPAKAVGGLRRYVVLGNLDTRSGLEVVLEGLLAARPMTTPVRFIGHAGETPTSHGLVEIARFAAHFQGEWSVSLGIDALSLANEIGPGDILLSHDDGGLATARSIAAARGAAYFGRKRGASIRDHVRAIAALVDAGGIEPLPPLDAAARTGLEAILADDARIERPSAPSSPAALARIEIVALVDQGDPDRVFEGLQATPGVSFTAITGRPARSRMATILFAANAAARRRILHDHIGASTADFVMILDERVRWTEGTGAAQLALAGCAAAAMAWPCRSRDGRSLHPPLLAPDLLVDIELVPVPVAVSPAHYRQHVPSLTTSTAIGIGREILLRLCLADQPVIDHAGIGLDWRPDDAASGVYPFEAQRDLRGLADIAAAATDPVLRDAIHLYQGQILAAAQHRGAGGWRLEPDAPPGLVRYRGTHDLPPGGRTGRRAWSPRLENLLGGLGRVRPFALQALPSDAGEERPETPPQPDVLVFSEVFVAWVAEQARTNSPAAAHARVEAALERAPAARRDALRSIARSVMEIGPSTMS